MEDSGQWRRALVDTLAGAIAGGVSRTVTSPLDVIKIRFQVQLEPTAARLLSRRGTYAASKYTGILQATNDILREEGVLLQDVQTVLASQGEPKVYPNLRSAFMQIAGSRGIRGLYAGLSPTLVEIIPYAGLQFGSYDTFKRWTKAWNIARFAQAGGEGDENLSSFQLFLCGLAAGTCAKVVCHLDVVKKRFQVEGLQRHPRYGARVEEKAYKGMWDAVRRIVLVEGWAGLYKGILPSVVKAAPAGAVTFVVYEYTSDWLESITISKIQGRVYTVNIISSFEV